MLDASGKILVSPAEGPKTVVSTADALEALYDFFQSAKTVGIQRELLVFRAHDSRLPMTPLLPWAWIGGVDPCRSPTIYVSCWALPSKIS